MDEETDTQRSDFPNIKSVWYRVFELELPDIQLLVLFCPYTLLNTLCRPPSEGCNCKHIFKSSRQIHLKNANEYRFATDVSILKSLSSPSMLFNLVWSSLWYTFVYGIFFMRYIFLFFVKVSIKCITQRANTVLYSIAGPIFCPLFVFCRPKVLYGIPRDSLCSFYLQIAFNSPSR